MTRIESPSSINTYHQCPRKYYYRYIAQLPTKKNIHQVRGNIVHSVLEEFFDINVEAIQKESYELQFKTIILDLLKQKWLEKKKDIFDLGLRSEEIGYYFTESQNMLLQWLDDFMDKLDEDNLVESFNELKPIREEEFVSEKHQVRGFIDAIHEGEEINLVDYKTSSRFEINNEIRLQLGIYALLYSEKNGKKPDKVTVNFLKFGEKEIEVTDELIEEAKEKCKNIQQVTRSKKADDYPMKEGPLCKWRTGQCDFYEHCFEKKDLKEKGT